MGCILAPLRGWAHCGSAVLKGILEHVLLVFDTI